MSNIQKNKVLTSALALGLMLSITTSVATAQSLSKSAKVGKGIYEIVYSEKGNAIYVASAGARGAAHGYIYKLNPQDLTILDSIDVKSAPAYGLGINQKTQTLYTSNTRNNSVSAIDLKTGKVVATISNGKEKSHTRELVVDEDRNLVYVSDVQEQGLIWVIDGKTNKFSHHIENVGEQPTGLAFDKKRNQLYVVNMGTKQVAVVNLATNKVLRSFPTGGESPINIVYDAKGDRLFVSDQKIGNVSVIKPETGEIIKTVSADKGAIGINFDAKKNRIYVANRGAGNVTVIDGANYGVIKTIETGTHPNTVAINQQNGAVYITNKAKGGRPTPGQPTSPADPNGDTVSLILP